MAVEAERRRAWIEGGLQPQADGTFLVRPFGWVGGVFALPDAVAKERYLAYCQRMEGAAFVAASVVVTLAIIASLVFVASRLVGDVQEAGWVWLCVGIGGLLMSIILAQLWHRARLKRFGARHVPRHRWDASRIRSNWSYYTDTELHDIMKRDLIYFGLMLVMVFLILFYSGGYIFDLGNMVLLLVLISWFPAVVGGLRELRSRRR